VGRLPIAARGTALVPPLSLLAKRHPTPGKGREVVRIESGWLHVTVVNANHGYAEGWLDLVAGLGGHRDNPRDKKNTPAQGRPGRLLQHPRAVTHLLQMDGGGTRGCSRRNPDAGPQGPARALSSANSDPSGAHASSSMRLPHGSSV
jgi:hypothetical protein